MSRWPSPLEVSQFNTSLSSMHEVIARRILRYLKGGGDVGIEYRGKERLDLKMLVDADSGASENRRSIGGHIVIFEVFCASSLLY
jgi:hypothetical protein